MDNSSRLGSGRFAFVRAMGVVVAVGCFGLAASGSASAAECKPEGADPNTCVGGDPRYYPIETVVIVTTTTTIPTTTTTVVGVQPPPPTTTTPIVVVKPPLPKTGSSGIGDSLMIGGTVALSGMGLVLVSRRRRRDVAAV